MTKSRTLVRAVVILALSAAAGFSSVAQATGVRCELVFQVDTAPARPTLTSYIEAGSVAPKGYKPPQYGAPKYEIKASKTWGGELGPAGLNTMLPPGMSFLQASVRGANEPGVIKTNSGGMVHLRATINKNGKTLGTNVGVNALALRDNLFRSTKTVARETSDAVVVFLHGGGTTTTGHHVGAQFLNWMSVRNVDVVSLDLDWHAMGARESITHVKDSLETIRAFIRQYISPSGKPVIIAGHSMGGVLSDFYMRLYPNDNLVKAVVPLSTIADVDPSLPPNLKAKLDDVIAERNSTNEEIPAEERAFSKTLAAAGKLSPVCGFYCDVIIYNMDWRIPADGGKSYLPALYVMGKGDALYQGYERNFQQYVGTLPNAQFKLIGKRRDLKDKDGTNLVTIGHLIFDHKPSVSFDPSLPPQVKEKVLGGKLRDWEFDGVQKLVAEGKFNPETGEVAPEVQADLAKLLKSKKYTQLEYDGYNSLVAKGLIKLDPGFKLEDLTEPETFVMIRNFIESLTGKSLHKRKENMTPVELFLQTWANNLAFRQFAKTYVYQHFNPTEKGKELGETSNRIAEEARNITYKVKGNKATPEDLVRLEQLNAMKKEIVAILNSRGLVKAEDRARFEALEAESKGFISKELARLSEERLKLKDEISKVRGTVTRAENSVADNDASLSSPNFDKARIKKAALFATMMKADSKVRELTRKYLHESYNYETARFKEGLFERLDPELATAFGVFDRASAEYQAFLKTHDDILLNEAQAGSLRIDGNTLSGEKLAEVREAIQTLIAARSTLQEMYRKATDYDAQISKLSTRQYEISLETAKMTGVDYFIPEYYTAADLFAQVRQHQAGEKDELAGVTQKIWSEWTKLWSARIVGESSESAY